MLYQSLRANGSVRFFKPFFPFDNLLFLPTAIFAVLCIDCELKCGRYRWRSLQVESFDLTLVDVCPCQGFP